MMPHSTYVRQWSQSGLRVAVCLGIGPGCRVTHYRVDRGVPAAPPDARVSLTPHAWIHYGPGDRTLAIGYGAGRTG